MKMKRIKMITIIVLFVLIITSGCGKKENPDFSEAITLDKDITLTLIQCSERGLENKVIMVESEWCSHCSNVKPLLEQISEEKEIEISFLNLGVDQEEVDLYGIEVKYTPTVIINCQVIIGERTKEYYENMM